MSVDEDAARIALLALGATIPRWEVLDEQRVRIAPIDTMFSMEMAAKFLASMPKPLICYASNEKGTLVVECELVAEAAPVDRRQFELREEREAELGGPCHEIVERYGEGDHLVAVFGRTGSAVVSLETVGAWSGDYHVAYSICREGDAFDPEEEDDPQYEDARQRGAKGVLQFSSLGDRVETMDGRTLMYPPLDSTSNEERAALEKGFVGIAKSLLFVMDQEEELATVERALVERGELPADSVSRHGRDHDAYVHGMLASQMAHFFREREMPAEVAAFVDVCRKE